MPLTPDHSDTETPPIYPRQEGNAGSGKLYQVVESDGQLESSIPLENSTPLEASRVRYVAAPAQPTLPPKLDERSQPPEQPLEQPPKQLTSEQIFPTALLNTQPIFEPTPPSPLPSQPSSEIVIPLLDERVIVDRQRRKVGEVVVRKEIETHIVEVPIRREKLIVEQVSPEYQQLAVVDLGAAQVMDADAPTTTTSPLTVSGEFTSAKSAIQFLVAIANDPQASLQTVQVTVALPDTNRQAVYQRWLDRHSTQVNP